MMICAFKRIPLWIAKSVAHHRHAERSSHQTFRFIGTHITLEEIQLIKTGLLRDILTEFDHFRIQLYAGDIGRLTMFCI